MRLNQHARVIVILNKFKRVWEDTEHRIREYLLSLPEQRLDRLWPIPGLSCVAATGLVALAGFWPATLLVMLSASVLLWRFTALKQSLESQWREQLLERLQQHSNGARPAVAADTQTTLRRVEQILEQTRQRWIVPRQDQEERHRQLEMILDAAPSAMISLNEQGCVSVINQAAFRIFKDLEPTLSAQITDFKAEALIGTPLLEQLGKKELLSGENSPELQAASITIGEATLMVSLCVLKDEQGQRLGVVTEWADNSARLRAEQRVQKVIGRAVSGSLDERLELTDLEGFMQGLGKGINMLMDAVQAPLQAITEIQKAVAKGDLSQQLEGLYLGEFGIVQNATNQSIGQLTCVVEKVRKTALEVNEAASNLRDGNDHLAVRTAEQTDALDDAASAIEQLTSTCKNNAENSAAANQLARNAHIETEQGRKEAQSAREAMEQIKKSNQSISRMVAMMEEVAFQTKLLSLNAAVEAAHAGEHGRSFAVVAAEVRKLADRSANAAKEIRNLAIESDQRVVEGAGLVINTSAALDSIADQIQNVSGLMGEIATATQEQYQGTEQVRKATYNVLQGVQKNQELVEEVADASKSLDGLAEALVSLMSHFQINPALAIEEHSAVDATASSSNEPLDDDFTIADPEQDDNQDPDAQLNEFMIDDGQPQHEQSDTTNMDDFMVDATPAPKEANPDAEKELNKPEDDLDFFI